MADDSLRDYGPAAPHGPNMTGEHTATANFLGNHPHAMSSNEKAVFDQLLLPDVSLENAGGPKTPSRLILPVGLV